MVMDWESISGDSLAYVEHDQASLYVRGYISIYVWYSRIL